MPVRPCPAARWRWRGAAGTREKQGRSVSAGHARRALIASTSHRIRIYLIMPSGVVTCYSTMDIRR